MTEQEAKQAIADKANEGLSTPIWTADDFEVYEYYDEESEAYVDEGWFVGDVIVSADGALSIDDPAAPEDISGWVRYSLLEWSVNNGENIPHDRIIEAQAARIAYLEAAMKLRDEGPQCNYCGGYLGIDECAADCPRVTHPLEGKP